MSTGSLQWVLVLACALVWRWVIELMRSQPPEPIAWFSRVAASFPVWLILCALPLYIVSRQGARATTLIGHLCLGIAILAAGVWSWSVLGLLALREPQPHYAMPTLGAFMLSVSIALWSAKQR